MATRYQWIFKFAFVLLTLDTYILDRTADVATECESLCSERPTGTCRNSSSDTGSEGMDVNYGLSLSSDKLKFDVMETVKFVYGVENGATIYYKMDYGDGDMITINNATNMDTHVFLVPGQYHVVIYATDKNTQKIVASSSLTLTVMQPLGPVLIDCPNIVAPFETFICNVSALRSDALTMSINTSDTSLLQEYTISDARFKILGHSVPQVEVADIQETSNEIILMPGTIMDSEGYIVGFEAYIAALGIIEFIVFTPSCTTGEFCYSESSCVNSCSAAANERICSEIYYPITDACQAGLTSSADSFSSYAQREKYQATPLKIGYQYFDLLNGNEPIKVYPGDVLGFRASGGAIVTHRNATPSEISSGKADKVSSAIEGPWMDSIYAHYASAIVTLPTTASIQHSYNTTGNFTFDVNCTSTKSNEKSLRNSKVIVVADGIGAITLNMEASYWKVGSEINVTATVINASDFTIEWDFGDNSAKKFQQIAGFIKEFSYFEKHTYVNEGNAIVTVTAWNIVDNASDTQEIFLQHPILDNIVLSSNSPQLSPPGTVKFTLQFSSSDPMPTNATINSSWGDGSSSSAIIPVDTTYVELSHDYASDGEFNVTMFLSNNVSNKTLTTLIRIYERIEGLGAVLSFWNTNSGTNYFKPAVGNNMDTVSTNSNVSIQITNARGMITGYSLYDKDGSWIQNATENMLYYTVMEKGQYNVTVYASNPLQTSDPLNLCILAEDLNLGLEIDDFFESTNMNETKLFQVTISPLSADTCVLIYYGDESLTNSLPEAYGEQATCAQKYTEDEYDFVAPTLQSPMNITHLYKNHGPYTCDVKAFSATFVSQASLTFTVTASNFPCSKPMMTITDRHTSVANAKKHARSDGFYVETATLVNCTGKVKTKKHWTIFKVDDQSGLKKEQIDVSTIKSKKKSILYVPPLFLPYGFYKFIYLIEIIVDDMAAFRWSHSLDTHVEIIPSSLKAGIIEGSMTEVSRGIGQIVTLNPAKFSTDPDFPDDSNFNITWFCRQVYPRKENYTIIAGKYDETIKVDVTTSSNSNTSSDNGGCFGTGTGALNLENVTEWNLNTSLFYLPRASYEIMVVIKKDIREGIAALTVELVDGMPPSVIIRCQNTDTCFPRVDGFLINPTNRLGLTGHCVNECKRPLYYNWKAYCDGIEMGNNTTYMTEKAYPDIALRKEFFGNNFAIKSFHLKLSVSGPNGVGSSGIFLRINQPPEQGSCSLSPTDGYAMLDVFIIQCSGWVDPEHHEITKYTYYVNADNEEGKAVIASSSKPSVRVNLPAGTLEVMVDISDCFGATTTVAVANISLMIPPEETFNAITSSSFISNLIGGGNQEKIVQAILAIASMEDAYFSIASNKLNDTEDEFKDYKIQMSERISQLLKGIETLTMGSLTDMEMISSATKAVVGNGYNMDAEGKQSASTLLDNMGDILEENITLRSPQEVRNFAQSAVTIMGALTNSIANTVIRRNILPSDLKNVDEIEYDTDIGDDFDFEMPKSLEGMHQEAIMEDTSSNGKQQVENIEKVFNQIGQKILSTLIPDEDTIRLDTDIGVNALFGRYLKNNISQHNFQVNDSHVILPEFCFRAKNGSNCLKESVGVQILELPSIMQSYGKQVNLLSENTKTIKIELFDDDNHIMAINNLTQLVDIFIPRMMKNGTSMLPPPLEIIPVIKWYEIMVYHQFNVARIESSVNIEITPDDVSQPLIIFVRFGHKPTLHEYDHLASLSNIPTINGTHDIFLSSLLINNRTGDFYIGIAQLNTSHLDVNYNVSGNLTNEMISSNFSTNYTIRIYTSGCYYYDSRRNSWRGNGCWVHQANYSYTHCKCNHLTTFGSGFFISPSTIDFDYVFAHTSFNDNLTIYVTLIITFVAFIIMIIWAHWKDKKDLEKLYAVPLPDNKAEDRYIYEILVSTGNKQSAATNSKVYFIISGERDETEVRQFGSNGKRSIFRRGEDDVFVMTVPRPLGPLNFMRVWHDNSGKGKYGSWYLNFIAIRDIQTGDKFRFIVNNWLAVEEGDGSVDRVLPVAGEVQLNEFSDVFKQTAKKGISDNHLWFSVFFRPPQSRFNRVQRVGCCVAFLYLSMLVNAMWYNTLSKSPKNNIFMIGPFSISTEEIGIGFISNFIVFLPNFVIIYFFRKARPRKLRAPRIDAAITKQNESFNEAEKRNTGIECGDNKNDAEIKLIDSDDHSEKQNKVKRSSQPEHLSKKFTLPWIFQSIAWLLIFLCIGASVFFLWSYGVTFGNVKTKKWVTTLVISFFSSVLITEPIKLFLVAMLFSAICKRSEDDDYDGYDDEEDPIFSANEEDLDKKPLLYRKRRYLQPPNPKALSIAREMRQKEIKMWAILREIFGYLLFLWVLVVVSYGNRDPNSYHLKQTLSKAFIRQGKDFDFNEMKSTAQFWNWTRNILIPRLRADNLYNNKPPFGYKGFLHDQVNRLMGHAIMRQIRINRDECTPPEIMENISHPCSGTFSEYLKEDHLSYDIGWNQTVIEDGEPVDKVHQAFRYRTPEALNGIPFVGHLDIYSGGGYVFEITGSTKDLKNEFTQLEQLNWLDRFSRAVIIQFSVYNTQVNLFGVCNIQLEFVPGGGFFQDYQFDGIRLLQYHDGFGLIVLICEIAFVIFLLFFMVCEITEMCKERKRYFGSYWNLAELCIILLSIGSIVVYVYRMIITKKLLIEFNQTKGNKYINLEFVHQLNQIFGYLISLVVFISIVKFIKLLRFNKRIGILSSTLSYAWAELTVFGGCFIIVFFAFAQLFYLLLSSTSLDFAGFLSAVEVTFSMMLNKFNYKEINRGCPVFGPIAFFIFALMTSIILINLFLTIVIKSFKNVAHDMSMQPNDYELVDFILNRFKSFVGISGVGRKINFEPIIANNGHANFDDDHCKAKQLSEKVDWLIDYMNAAHFDGKTSDDQKQPTKIVATNRIYTDTN